MKSVLQRNRGMMAFTGLAAAGSLLSLSCASNPTEAEKANQKRWTNFQNDNKRDRAVGASAFEKRQAQLAEKRRKEAENAGAKAGADAPGTVVSDAKEKKPN